MHVIMATDGSKQSLAAAKYLKTFADPTLVTEVSVIAVVRPLAAVGFADDLAEVRTRSGEPQFGSFREAADHAVQVVAEALAGWGPKINKRVRSGSPANEIIKAATSLDAGLVVVASGSRGISETVLLGSTAQRVQQYAPCPVLVVRPAPRKKATRQKA
ncbi:MAG: Universal stress protein UspA and related nucleotide-binding proteins [uncultured Nocardioidaceae bacterium]|uniref:Universal stress protein UspA and related nucleotide-binding proteins n=1 Tax=uncultured Nocardioidaceae bacterium TaxID=253824 RepID=A0A6J4MHP9_9ACTN|nr:MAG: Universal stress protein UspA and related nucleotide-binding proteins [uncultured Nocardioidaceae bacterium]